MKPIPVLLLGLALLRPARADVQVMTHAVEMSQERLSQLLAEGKTGEAFFLRVRESVKAGEARSFDTGLVRVRSGERVLTGSIQEVIFPGTLTLGNCFGAEIPKPQRIVPPLRLPFVPTILDTRNTGTHWEFEPSASGGPIDVRLRWDQVSYPTDFVIEDWRDERGERHVRKVPAFVKLGVETALTLAPGKWQLAGTCSPHDAAGKIDFSRKLLLFVRADEVP